MTEFKVDSDSAGVRADVFLTSKYTEFTRSSLESLFTDKKVFVGDKSIRSSYKTRVGEKLVVDDTILKTVPDPIDLEVIYEDDDVMVVNKPAGVLTHSKGALNLEATVASFIKPKLKDMKDNRAGIVHRLDRGTSGVIITAKNEASSKWLQKQFVNRKVKKTYVAVLVGKPEQDEAIIDAPIIRNPAKPQTFKVASNGKSARTHYKVIKTLQKDSDTYSLVEFKPETGRTHQLRIHAKHIGHPIVGDFVYGSGDSPMLLHAYTLELTLPNHERKVFTVEPPTYLEEFINGK